MTPSEEQDLKEAYNNPIPLPHDITAFITQLEADRDRLAERVKELEANLRLNLAVAPDDPLLLTPLEQRLATVEADNAALGSALSEALSHFVHPQSIGSLENAYGGTMWKETRDKLYDVLKSTHPGTALTQRLAGMEEALKFYGDTKNYENNTVDIGVGSMEEPNSNEVYIDHGKKAQQALDGKE